MFELISLSKKDQVAGDNTFLKRIKKKKNKNLSAIEAV